MKEDYIMTDKTDTFFLTNTGFNYLLCKKRKPQLKKYNETSMQEPSCPISMISFDENSEVAELWCGHYFEPDALKHWLEEQSKNQSVMSCPLCREKLDLNVNKCIKQFVKMLMRQEEIYLQERIISDFINSE